MKKHLISIINDIIKLKKHLLTNTKKTLKYNKSWNNERIKTLILFNLYKIYSIMKLN